MDPAKINYVAFRGGGETTAAILGGNVTIGGSGYSSSSSTSRPADACDRRHVGSSFKGINVPTLRNWASTSCMGNWRGVYGAPASPPTSAGADRP